MAKKLITLLSFFLNSFAFVSIASITGYVLWQFFGKSYIWSEPVGGDYFNALTYQAFFSKYLPNPISGWLPFWNEGTPVIGGYPSLTFYLTHFLTNFFDLETALNTFSVISLVLFFVASLALFWQASKNWLIATGFILIMLVTQASYYQLTVGGFMTATSAQWYLPVVLFFIYRFRENSKIRYLIASAIFSGTSLIHQGPASLLMIVLPSMVVLAFLKVKKSSAQRLSRLIIFALISISIGSIGLYTVFFANILRFGNQYLRQCRVLG